MSVDFKHPTYEALLPKWTKVEIVNSGEDEVHAAGTALLPMLEQQTQAMYNSYVERTRFLNAFNRTVQGLEGTVTRRETIVHTDDNEDLEELSKNITTTGMDLLTYREMVLNYRLVYGVCGTLVDHVKSDPDLSVAEAEEQNLRPNFAFYGAKSLINWKYDTVNNVRLLVMVVLEEIVTVWVDEFETEEETQYRVLKIDEDGDYYQQMYKKGKGTEYIAEEKVYPLLDGERLRHIPFYLHGKHENPPLYDLCTNNVKHYQLKADHNHCLHYIGLPTPIFTGSSPEDPKAPKSIGPERIVHLENPQSQAFYMELEGKGIDEIVKELETIKTDMAYLGANMLAPESIVQETATKSTIRRASETSALSKLVTSDNKTVTEAYQFFSLWAGLDEEASKEVYTKMSTDFDPVRLTSQDLIALVQSWQNGAFSKQTLFANLQQGEIVDGKSSFEDEEELISNVGAY